MSLVSSIPSPSFNSFDIGPLSLNIYGLAIACGVIAAVWLFGKRLEERHAGTTDDASSIAIWAVIAGVIGARLYHVITDWDRFTDNYAAIPKLWEGGLGIPGGLAAGIPVGLIIAKRKGISMPMAATCAAPAIPLAQAIGRLGNYFNQELYGKATDLPWALEIDDAHLLDGFASGTTFHPTFLYELLWSLALCGVLLWIDRKWRPGLGQLMAMYIMGYGLGRFWVEGLRIDRADELGGLRWNQWVAIAMVVGGGIVLAVMRRNPILEETDPFADRDESVADVVDDGTADAADAADEVGADAVADADRLDSDLEPVTADPDD
jgi:prolipoprotein diacylglyceryl transferase